MAFRLYFAHLLKSLSCACELFFSLSSRFFGVKLHSIHGTCTYLERDRCKWAVTKLQKTKTKFSNFKRSRFVKPGQEIRDGRRFYCTQFICSIISESRSARFLFTTLIAPPALVALDSSAIRSIDTWIDFTWYRSPATEAREKRTPNNFCCSLTKTEKKECDRRMWLFKQFMVFQSFRCELTIRSHAFDWRNEPENDGRRRTAKKNVRSWNANRSARHHRRRRWKCPGPTTTPVTHRLRYSFSLVDLTWFFVGAAAKCDSKIRESNESKMAHQTYVVR